MTRAYRPATIEVLRDARASGVLPADPDVVLAASESEEDEYAALMTAADASAERVAASGTPGRRVVVVVEVASPGAAEAEVEMRRVVAVHADDDERDWSPGASGVDAGDPDADLGWWATQELDRLV